jgi:hypothetical protein
MAGDPGDIMEIRLRHGLLWVSASLLYSGKQLLCKNVLVDTGSAGTVFSVDRVFTMGMQPEPADAIRELRGVGGTEFVFVKRIDQLILGDFGISDFEIELGTMDYGMEIDGIIGLDFLLKVKAKIDLERLEIY